MEEFKPRNEVPDERMRQESIGHLKKVAELITPFISEYAEEFMAHRAEIENLGIHLCQDPLPKAGDNFTPAHSNISISGMEKHGDFGWLAESTRIVDAVTSNLGADEVAGREGFPIVIVLYKFLEGLELIKAKNVIWAPNMYADTSSEYPPYLVTPVGGYGDELAQKIQLVTARLLKGTSFVEDAGKKLFEDDASGTLRRTVRGSDFDSGFTPVAMLQEGIVTLANTVALLSAERVEGYEDPDELVEAILSYNLPNEMAKKMPSGVINPVALSGRYISGLTHVAEDGRLELNTSIVEAARVVKETVRRSRGWDISYNPSLGYGCPVAVRPNGSSRTGIEVLQVLFLEEYRRISANQKS